MGVGRELALLEGIFEDADPSDGAADVEVAFVVDDGDARGIVAAIFQPFESFDEQRLGDFSADVSDDSAHIFLPRALFWRRTQLPLAAVPAAIRVV